MEDIEGVLESTGYRSTSIRVETKSEQLELGAEFLTTPSHAGVGSQLELEESTTGRTQVEGFWQQGRGVRASEPPRDDFNASQAFDSIIHRWSRQARMLLPHGIATVGSSQR